MVNLEEARRLVATFEKVGAEKFRYAIDLRTDGTFNLNNVRAGQDLIVTPGRGTMDSMLTIGGANDINELD